MLFAYMVENKRKFLFLQLILPFKNCFKDVNSASVNNVLAKKTLSNEFISPVHMHRRDYM